MSRANRRRNDKGRRAAKERERTRNEVVKTGMHTAYFVLAACLLEVRKEHHFGKIRLTRILNGTSDRVNNALCASELFEELKAQTGIDLREWADANDEGVDL